MPQASKKAPHIVEGKRKPSGFPNTIPPPALPGSGYRVWSRGLPLSRPYASTPLFDLLRPEPPSVFGQQQHTAFPPFCQPLSNIGRKIPSLTAFANFSLDIFPPGAYNQYALSREPFAPVAQLDRVFGYEPKGQGFESLAARQNKNRDFKKSRFLFFLSVSQNFVLRHGNRFVRSRLMPKSSAFRHSRIYRRKIRGACPRIFWIFIEIGLRPKSFIDSC